TKTFARRHDQLPTTHPIAADVPDIESVRLNFDGITYEKGASVLRQLGAWVGDEAFLGSMNGYFREHEYGNATLADFLGALERNVGDGARRRAAGATVRRPRPRQHLGRGRHRRRADAAGPGRLVRVDLRRPRPRGVRVGEGERARAAGAAGGAGRERLPTGVG